MQNHGVFFVPNAAAMCEFTTAGVVDGNYDAYLDTHPDTKRVLDEMAKVEASCLMAKYWAILPFALGEDAAGCPRYVKYQLVPEGQPAGQPFDQSDYLALDQWVLGDLEADYDPHAKSLCELSELPVAAQPEMLTRGALEFCLADAFHPGCEMDGGLADIPAAPPRRRPDHHIQVASTDRNRRAVESVRAEPGGRTPKDGAVRARWRQPLRCRTSFSHSASSAPPSGGTPALRYQ